MKRKSKPRPLRPKFLVHLEETFPIGVTINISKEKKGIVEINYRKSAEKVLPSFLGFFLPSRVLLETKRMHTNKYKVLYRITAPQELELLDILENPPSSFIVNQVKSFGRMFR